MIFDKKNPSGTRFWVEAETYWGLGILTRGFQ